MVHEDDVYTITMTRSDGGGTETHTATATLVADGLYTATLSPVPTISGTYSMSINLENQYTRRTSDNQAIQNAPFTVIIHPGEILPASCYTDISGEMLQTAGVDYTFSMYFVDLWDNLHYQTLQDELDNGMEITITAQYLNHVNYPSPIDMSDLSDWQRIYGS